MKYKNINLTNSKETLISIYYIDSYIDECQKSIIQKYKFNNEYRNEYLLSLLMDICIDMIIENKDADIIFTYPPSTMYHRKEKSIDSMGNLILQVKKYLNFYFRRDAEKYYFKNLFSINKKYLKNKKAQHINGSREARTRNLDQRYYINFWNKRFLKKLTQRKTIICIIDDVSSTGGTLLACKNSLSGFDVEVRLYSLMH